MKRIAFDPTAIADLQDLSERGKGSLPDGFVEYISYAEGQLIERKSPGRWASRGVMSESGVKLAEAILFEVKILICGNDAKYREVVKSGKNFARSATAAIGGYIAAAFGIGLALATSAVALALLLVSKVGVAAFCKTFAGVPATSSKKNPA
jgi:hypothetical protein